MNCTTFQKRLHDLIEDNITFDLKDAMLKHIEECEHCSNIYLEESSIDEAFQKAFKEKAVSFSSSRTQIMKNIDKNRYSKNPIKKIYYHIKKYKKSYASCAALLLIGVFTASYLRSISFNLSGAQKNASEAQSKANMKFAKTNLDEQRLGAPKDEKLLKEQTNELSINNVPQTNGFFSKTMLEFIRLDIDKGTEPKYGTSWKNSFNSKLSACIEGKGPEVSEEGVGIIYVRNLITLEEWSLRLPGETQQNSPKDILWVDDDNFLAIIGLGFGTVSRGGALYLVNAKTGVMTNADQMQTVKLTDVQEISRIASVTRDNGTGTGTIHVEVSVHDAGKMKIIETKYVDIPFPYYQLRKEIMPEGQN